MPDPQPAAPSHQPAAPRRRPRGPLGPILLGLLALVLLTVCGYGTEEIWCNEALAHLHECCPSLDASVYSCNGPSTGCEHYAFDVEEGKRIARTSCRELVAQGACTSPFPPPARIAP